MKIIHTSDWHIGRTLYGKKRYEEFEAFLTWLISTIEANSIEALLISGDVFDTSTPSNRAQELYYNFLCRVARTTCHHVIITAGNHDSPSFLSAPAALLKFLNVHVVAALSENPDDEIMALKDKDGNEKLIVCAVPYLRDRDIRVSCAGETYEVKERNFLDGIKQHYIQVISKAKEIQITSGNNIPIVAMGHLFTSGGFKTDGDGVRDLYVGTCLHVDTEIFTHTVDYVALGHLHVAQCVGGTDKIRYSGSPIPMSFGEASQQKSVVFVDFSDPVMDVKMLSVPVFQKLVQIKGDLDHIQAVLEDLIRSGSSAWLEIVYDGQQVVGDLKHKLESMVKESGLEILRIKNIRLMQNVGLTQNSAETLDELTVFDVFERCLNFNSVPVEQRSELMHLYKETVATIYENDISAV